MDQDELFQTLIATAVDGIMVIDETGTVQVYNGACEKLFLYPPEEVLNKNITMLMPSPYREEHDSYLARYRSTGERRIIGIGREVEGRRKDGTTFPMYLSVGEGSLSGKRIFVGIVHDLTAAMDEAERREGIRRQMSLIVESSHDAIVSMTLNGIVTSWNSAAERMYGYTAEEMIGRSIMRVIPGESQAEEAAILERVQQGRATDHYETKRIAKDGTEIEVSLSVSPLRDGPGNIVGASKIARDIGAAKRAEARIIELQAELMHMTRLTSMGQLSSALAHELNQPLTATLNYLNAARRGIDKGTGNLPDLLEKASRQVERAGQIIRRLRDFVEKRETSRSIEDVNALTKDAIVLGLVGTAHLGVKLNTRLEANPPHVLVDRVQVQQVLINLMRNAVEAMQDSRVRNLDIATESSDDAFATVSVVDTGTGVPPEIAEKLFQPFISGKSSGMGVGLAISRSIIEAHGGRLWMSPNEGGGTAFRFTLPLQSKDEGP